MDMNKNVMMQHGSRSFHKNWVYYNTAGMVCQFVSGESTAFSVPMMLISYFPSSLISCTDIS